MIKSAFTPLHLNFDSPTWLRPLRWFAIGGMGLATLGAYLAGALMNYAVLVSILAGLLVWNFLLPQIERAIGADKSFLFIQVLVDLAVLTGMLWFSGGLVNPFSTFYIFHVMIAGLILSYRKTLFVASLSKIYVLCLIFAPPLRFPERTASLFQLAYWPGIPFALIVLILCTMGFILVYFKRLRRYQMQLNQREKMIALGRLTGGLAHELGTPLNSILLLAKNLEEKIEGSGIEQLRLIQQQTKRCGDLVSLLLGYTKPGGTENIIHQKTVCFCDFIDEIIASIGCAERIKFDIHCNNERVNIPELAARQVLTNIIKNASQAVTYVMNPRIVIEAKQEKKPASKQDTKQDSSAECAPLVIHVHDNGPGFSDEQRAKAFEAFFTTKNPGEGSGLGLYISYFLLEQVGGKVSIEDSKYLGASIRIELPSEPINTIPEPKEAIHA